MKRLLLLLFLGLTLSASAQTTPWSPSPPVTQQTRKSSGSDQLRFIWGSSGMFSLPDTLARFVLKSNVVADYSTSNNTLIPSTLATANLLYTLKIKQQARVMTTTNITLSGSFTYNTVAIVPSNYVFVDGQTDQTQNGLYISQAGAWVRSNDCISGGNLSGAIISIGGEDPTHGGQLWINEQASITIGVTNVTFHQIGGAGTYTASNGVALSAGNFSADTGYLRTTANSFTLAALQTKFNSKQDKGSTLSGFNNYLPFINNSGQLVASGIAYNLTGDQLSMGSTKFVFGPNAGIGAFPYAVAGHAHISYNPSNSTLERDTITYGTAASIALRQQRTFSAIPSQTLTRPIAGDSVAQSIGKIIKREDSTAAAVATNGANIATNTAAITANTTAIGLRKLISDSTSTTGYQTVGNFFPKADPRYEKITSLGWTNVADRSYGADTTGVVDATSAIRACVAANLNVRLSGKLLLTDSIKLRSGQHIYSDNATIIFTQTNKTIFNATDINNWAVKGKLKILGGNYSAGTAIGFNIYGGSNYEITGVTIDTLAGTGIKISPSINFTSAYSAANRGNIGLIHDNFFLHNYVGAITMPGVPGLGIFSGAEYVHFDNNDFINNGTNVSINSGNTTVRGGNIMGARTLGLYVGAGTNNAHGIIANVNINHNKQNIKIENTTLGMSFEGVHVYFPQPVSTDTSIIIKNSMGIKFVGGTLDGKIALQDTTSSVMIIGTQIGPNYSAIQNPSYIYYRGCTNLINRLYTGNQEEVITRKVTTLDNSVNNYPSTSAVTTALLPYVKTVVLNTPSVIYTNPITFTTSGNTATGTLTLNTQTANTVLSGPTSGGAATPAFRALVAADIPALPYGTGTVTNVATGNGLTGGPITSTGTLKLDTAIAQTVLNFFPKGDTRYAPITGSAIYAVKSNNLSDLSSINTARVNLKQDIIKNVADANYTILGTDREVYYTSITVPRTLTLPAANSVNPGYEYIIGDASGSVTTTNTITIARAGADLINGNPSETIQSAYGQRKIFSDGVSKWVFDGGTVRLTQAQILTNKDLTSVTNTFPTFNQNTTGTAANITAPSNSTITTLSALSLPYSQLTGTPSLSGYLTAIGVTSANGVSGTSSGGTTPNLTIALGAITPTTINTTHLPANVFQTPIGTAGTDSLVVKIGSTKKMGAVASTSLPYAPTIGSSSITTLGTIGTGTWQGTAIADAYIASSTNWNSAYTNRITSLTTTGSGAATLVANVLNIPTPTGSTGANPTATAGASAVNGSAATFMRSDAAPKIDSAVFQTVLNFFPKGDTRYVKKDGSGNVIIAGTLTVNGSTFNLGSGSSLLTGSSSMVYTAGNGNHSFINGTGGATLFQLGDGTHSTLSFAPHLQVYQAPAVGNDVMNKRSADSLYRFTTLAGYGITDAYTKTAGDARYPISAGLAGGQSITGGTAASESLTLLSTANATKGKIIFGGGGTTAFDAVNDRFGVGTNAPNAKFESLATTEQVRASYDATHYSSFTTGSTGNLTITPTGGTLTIGGNFAASGTNYGIFYTGYANSFQPYDASSDWIARQRNNSFGFLFKNSGGTTVASISSTGVGTFSHLVGNTSAPTIAAGTGAGTSPTVSVSGNDIIHKVTITTGTSPIVSATVATITFNVAYGVAPKVILTPVGANSAALSGTAQVYVDDASSSTTVYVIKVGSGGLAASTTYTFYASAAQ